MAQKFQPPAGRLEGKRKEESEPVERELRSGRKSVSPSNRPEFVSVVSETSTTTRSGSRTVRRKVNKFPESKKVVGSPRQSPKRKISSSSEREACRSPVLENEPLRESHESRHERYHKEKARSCSLTRTQSVQTSLEVDSKPENDKSSRLESVPFVTPSIEDLREENQAAMTSEPGTPTSGVSSQATSTKGVKPASSKRHTSKSPVSKSRVSKSPFLRSSVSKRKSSAKSGPSGRSKSPDIRLDSAAPDVPEQYEVSSTTSAPAEGIATASASKNVSSVCTMTLSPDTNVQSHDEEGKGRLSMDSTIPNTDKKEDPSGDDKKEPTSGDDKKEDPSGDDKKEPTSGDDKKEDPSGDDKKEPTSGDDKKEDTSGDDKEVSGMNPTSETVQRPKPSIDIPLISSVNPTVMQSIPACRTMVPRITITPPRERRPRIVTRETEAKFDRLEVPYEEDDDDEDDEDDDEDYEEEDDEDEDDVDQNKETNEEIQETKNT